MSGSDLVRVSAHLRLRRSLYDYLLAARELEPFMVDVHDTMLNDDLFTRDVRQQIRIQAIPQTLIRNNSRWSVHVDRLEAYTSALELIDVGRADTSMERLLYRFLSGLGVRENFLNALTIDIGRTGSIRNIPRPLINRDPRWGAISTRFTVYRREKLATILTQGAEPAVEQAADGTVPTTPAPHYIDPFADPDLNQTTSNKGLDAKNSLANLGIV